MDLPKTSVHHFQGKEKMGTLTGGDTPPPASLPNSVEKQTFRVEVVHRLAVAETHGSALVKAAHRPGAAQLSTCQVGRLFFQETKSSLLEPDDYQPCAAVGRDGWRLF